MPQLAKLYESLVKDRAGMCSVTGTFKCSEMAKTTAFNVTPRPT